MVWIKLYWRNTWPRTLFSLKSPNESKLLRHESISKYFIGFGLICEFFGSYMGQEICRWPEVCGQLLAVGLGNCPHHTWVSSGCEKAKIENPNKCHYFSPFCAILSLYTCKEKCVWMLILQNLWAISRRIFFLLPVCGKGEDLLSVGEGAGNVGNVHFLYQPLETSVYYSISLCSQHLSDI